MANPFAAQFHSRASNPNQININSTPWKPPNSTNMGSSHPATPGAIPYGGWGGGPEAPLTGPAPSGGPQLGPVLGKNNFPTEGVLHAVSSNNGGGGSSASSGGAYGGAANPWTAVGQPQPRGTPPMVLGSAGFAKGGSVKAFDYGGDSGSYSSGDSGSYSSGDGQMSAMDMGGGDPGSGDTGGSYAPSGPAIAEQPSGTPENGGYYGGSPDQNYTVDLSQALGSVMDTLQASRDAVSPQLDKVSPDDTFNDTPTNAQHVRSALDPSQPSADKIQNQLNEPGAFKEGPASAVQPRREQTAANDAPSQSQSQIGNQQWGPNNSRPSQGAPPAREAPLQINPAGSTNGRFGKLADLGNEGQTQFMAAGGSVGTKAYDDGGAIPDDTDTSADTSLPGPVTSDTGDPSALEQEDQAEATQAAPSAPDPQMLARYASGADAVSPDEAAAAEQEVDPNGQMDPAARAMAAIHNAASQGNKQKAIGLLQHNRNSFNVKRHAARAALDRGNHQEAVRMANAAMQHVPNGHSVHITAHGNGVHIHSHSLIKRPQ